MCKFKDSILSYVKNINQALYYSEACGPSFGSSDLKLSFSVSADHFGMLSNQCKQVDYEKKNKRY